MQRCTDMTKKALAVLACACLALALLPAAALAQAGDALTTYAWSDVVDSGACGDELAWTLTGTEEVGYTLTISGTGDMWDCQDYSIATGTVEMPDGKPQESCGKSPWDTYRQDITSAVIGEGVTSIGSHAFYGHSALKAVVLAESVTTIEKSAFERCAALTDISIPDGVREIDQCAFRYCSSLVSMTIPDGVTSLGGCLFSYCSALATVTIGEGADKIEDEFYDCTSLRSVYIGSGVKDICWSFQLCTTLKTIEVSPDNPCFASADGVLFDKGQTKLIKYPLAKEGSSYAVPDTVTAIDDRAFSSSLDNCDNLPWVGNPFLESVLLSNNTATIGKGAFAGCDALREFICGEALDKVDQLAFYGCDALTDVYYAGTEEQWAAIEVNSDNTPLLNATIHYERTIGNPDSGDGNPNSDNPESPDSISKVGATDHSPVALSVAQTVKLSKGKAVLQVGKKAVVKVKGVKTELCVKVSKKTKKALKVIAKGKKKVVIKSKASAKAGTYKVKFWAKKGAGYAKSTKKTLKVRVK